MYLLFAVLFVCVFTIQASGSVTFTLIVCILCKSMVNLLTKTNSNFCVVFANRVFVYVCIGCVEVFDRRTCAGPKHIESQIS